MKKILIDVVYKSRPRLSHFILIIFSFCIRRRKIMIRGCRIASTSPIKLINDYYLDHTLNLQ